jgi:hypothetical protein
MFVSKPILKPMKTKTVIQRTVMAVAIMLTTCFATKSSAQVDCDFIIQNNLPCNVTVDITFYTYPSCTPCLTMTGLVIPAASPYIIDCATFAANGCTNPSCDVQVQITDIGGTSYTSGVGSTTNNHVNLPGVPAPCAGPGSHFNIHPHGMDIHP